MTKVSLMSKLKLVKDTLKLNKSNLRFLMGVLKEGNTSLSQKQYVTFAYHFAINGDYLSAQKFLNKITPYYFSTEIYKDLYKSLLAWSVRDTIWTENSRKEYEYFVIVKRSLPVFGEFNFIAKKEFLDFRLEFLRSTTVIG